jgi:hypothetical protein
MSKDIKPKIPNIRLKEGATPITISGKAFTGGNSEAMLFPTEQRQRNGWHSKEAKRIKSEYGDRYE